MGNLKEKLPIERWKVLLTLFVTIAMIFGWLINTIYSASTIEQRMFDSPEQKTQVIQDVQLNMEHRKDINVHMPYQKKTELFVTRKEYEESLEFIKEALKEIKQDIRKR